jgi:hypothetical protein
MASTVLVHAIAAIARASIFLAAQDFAFTASLCYAKIAPAALHCGDFDRRCCENAEANGRMPKSELSDFLRASPDRRHRSCKRPGWHEVKQSVPDA